MLSLVINLAESDLKRSLDLVDVLDLLKSRPDTSVDTENFVVGALIVNDSGERHVLEHIIKFLEDRVGVVDILTETAGTLLAQTQVSVHISVFVVTSEHEDLLGVFKFECHQETDDLQTLTAFVNVVTQEKVIKTTDVASLAWMAPNVQESHQVNIVTMDVTKYFNWGLESLNDRGLSLQNV